MSNQQELSEQYGAAFHRLSQDIMTWGELMFPKHFQKATPDFHYELVMAAAQNQFLGVASPRRSAKSTRLSFLYPIHRIVFKKEPFIVLVSNTFKKAAMYLDAIKFELQENQLLRQTHPGITMPRDAEGDTIIKHPDGFKTLFICKGVDQLGSLRGVKFGPHRPGLVILDDVEDDELVRSSERRNTLKDEFDEVIGRIGHDKTQIVVVGTILHDDSQLAKLVSTDQYPKYTKIVYRAHIKPDMEGERSLWPEAWSLEELKKMRKEEPNVYAKEMQNDPVAGQNTRFRREDFRYWKEENGRIFVLDDGGAVKSSYAYDECRAAIACDLAWKERRSSDASVLMPGLLTPNSEILVCDYIHEKGLKPDKVAEYLFVLVERYERLTRSTVPIGLEKSMLENVTQWLLKKEMRARNKFLSIKELTWDADKDSRIVTRLQPRYSQHVIYHTRSQGELETQLTRFPSGVHDDLPDALQGLVQLLQFPKERVKKEGDDLFASLRKYAIDEKYGRTSQKINGKKDFPYQVIKSPF